MLLEVPAVILRPLPADAVELRDAYACFPTGITALCALGRSGPVGIAASSFTSVSIDPPLVSVCVQATSTTWPHLRQVPRLGVSILAEHQEEICRALAGKGDRFRQVEWQQTDHGAVLVNDASAWFDCSIYQETEAGDHRLVLLEVHAMLADRQRQPLVFHHSKLRRLAGCDDIRRATPTRKSTRRQGQEERFDWWYWGT
jgi:flavin reductase (DIM6/NTAB) family NADH-FMN oxidoreductase RutF